MTKLGLKFCVMSNKNLCKFFSGVPLDQLEPSVFAKAKAGKGRDNAQKQKDIAALEAQIYHLTEILGVSENLLLLGCIVCFFRIGELH